MKHEAFLQKSGTSDTNAEELLIFIPCCAPIARSAAQMAKVALEPIASGQSGMGMSKKERTYLPVVLIERHSMTVVPQFS